MPAKNVVKIQVYLSHKTIPYIEKYMRERGYDFASQAVRRMILEYLSRYYDVPIEELDDRYGKHSILKTVRV